VILVKPMIDDLPPDDYLFSLLCNFNSSSIKGKKLMACGRQYIIRPLNFPPSMPAQLTECI
jgi:hypothetical protein